MNTNEDPLRARNTARSAEYRLVNQLPRMKSIRHEDFQSFGGGELCGAIGHHVMNPSVLSRSGVVNFPIQTHSRKWFWQSCGKVIPFIDLG